MSGTTSTIDCDRRATKGARFAAGRMSTLERFAVAMPPILELANRVWA
jgi:hypothetical protein